jgi:hypothetical protein
MKGCQAERKRSISLTKAVQMDEALWVGALSNPSLCLG